MSNLLDKLADDMYKFLSEKLWAVIKFRYLEYHERLDKRLHTAIREADWNEASSLSGQMQGIVDIIEITERIGNEIKNNKIDINKALDITENKYT